MIGFIDREEEIKTLENEWEKGRASFVIVYGRRRTGKTELVIRFIERHGGIYYLADKKTYRENLKSFQGVVSDFLKDELFARAEFENWVEAFQQFTKRLKKRTVIVIDEFPYLLERGVLEEFQKIWDINLSKQKHMLILVGSSISMMEKSLLSYRSPLYGRRSAQIKLEPLKFWDIKEFFPHYDFEELLKVYGTLDGIPQYLLLFSSNITFRENMIRNCLTKSSPLYEDGEILLRDELRELRRYFSILESIAQGKRSFGEIKNKVGMESNALARYLNILRGIGIIMEDTPLFGKREKRYRLADNYFKFWFRYIYPNKWLIESGKGERLMEIIEKDFNNYLGQIFEEVVREFVAIKMNYDMVKKWWNRKGEEIDIVAMNDDEILFGEVKWRNRKMGYDVVEELKRKKGLVEHGRKKVKFLVVSKSGFTENCRKRMDKEGIIHWNLSDLKRMMKMQK